MRIKKRTHKPSRETEIRKFIDRVNGLPRTLQGLNSFDVFAVVEILRHQPPDIAQRCWEPIAQLISDVANANPESTPYEKGKVQ